MFGPEGCTEKFLPIVESMVSDQMFYVRKEAAAAVGSLSTAVPPSVTLERLVSNSPQYKIMRKRYLNSYFLLLPFLSYPSI